MRCGKWLCITVTIVLFILFWHFFYADAYNLHITSVSGTLICLFYGVINVMLGRIYGAYRVGHSRVSELIYSLCLADAISGGIVYFVSALSMRRLPSVLPMLAIIASQAVWNMLWSLTVNKIFFRLNRPIPTAVIYRTKEELKKLDEIRFFHEHYEIIRWIEDPREGEALRQALADCGAVFVLGIREELRQLTARYCVERRMNGFFTPEEGELIMSGAEHMQMYSVPLLRVSHAAPSMEYLFLKRLMDVVLSLIAAVVTSPFMLATALAVKLYDRGPVLYKQVRLTQDGREFSIFKFRSMKVDAEKDGVARLATEGDDRITPVGKVIRACRLDELPQLFNILKGDMALVGPRPERPEIAAQYTEELPAFALRLQVKAGLTGLAQVYGRYNTDPRAKLQMDLMYINKMSLVEDLRLMFATVKMLFVKESTAGIQEGCVTAGVKNQEWKGKSA